MNKSIAGIALFASIALIGTSAWAGKHVQRRSTAAEAQDMVKRAIAFFDSAGEKAAFDRFTNSPAPEFKKADLYIFVLKAVEGGPIVAHGAFPDRIGKNAATPDLVDDATPRGAWVDYKWKDPLTEKFMQKSSWVVRHKGYVFGCGIYKP